MPKNNIKMKSMKAMNLSPVRSLKQEREKTIFDDADDDDATLEDINNLLSMPLPSLSSKFLIPADPKDEFLRLTTMVRAVYFSYLHKCLLSNYILCYKEKNKEIACEKLKKCADEMELTAVRSALAASLYRQNMLKMISEIKSHTSEKKTYKKLELFLETQPDKIDVAVQTNNTWAELEKLDNIQSVCITSNCEELSAFIETCTQNNDEKVDDKCLPEDASPHSTFDQTASPTVNSTSFHEIESTKLMNESDEDAAMKPIVEDVKEEPIEIFTDAQPVENIDTQITNNQSCIYNDEENSQDSLLQHMEDMFCESDDSSDLTKLIEKHSGVSKANIDKEINKMCLESNSFLPPSNNSNRLSESNNIGNLNSTHSNIINTGNTNSGKLSYNDYKEMKSRGTSKPVASEPETVEMKQKRRASGIWFVERVHQVSKLKALMTELSLRNYRKHGRVKQKFIELFGDSDDEEMMPDSPICIEEHLTACKERIAPWIVNHLMPFYKKRRIKDRQLFKAVAKHITDMLIIENTFPEEDCVSKYIENYFKNKKFIKAKQDIYL